MSWKVAFSRYTLVDAVSLTSLPRNIQGYTVEDNNIIVNKVTKYSIRLVMFYSVLKKVPALLPGKFSENTHIR